MKKKHHRLIVGNPAGKIRLGDDYFHFFIPEFSRPTGRYASKWLIRVFNAFLRNRGIAMLNNPCTPGIGLPDLSEDQLIELRQKSPFRTVIVNKRNALQGSPDEIEAEPFMILKIRGNWNSMSDYIADMSSKYRVRTKKVYELSHALVCEKLTGENIPGNILQEIAELLKQTLSKKTLALPPDLEGLLSSFANQYGKQFEAAIYKTRENEIIGFLSRVFIGDTAYAMHIGYKAEKARDLHLYQRMMYDLIGEAIEKKLKVVNLGRTATEIKSTLGAEPQQNYFQILSRSRLINAGLRIYKKYFYKASEYTIRYPFKV